MAKLLQSTRYWRTQFDLATPVGLFWPATTVGQIAIVIAGASLLMLLVLWGHGSRRS